MNNSIYFDSLMPDDERRRRIYEGQLFVYSPTAASLAFCKFARKLAEEVLAPYDPREAQHHIEVSRYAEILNELKPRFIHHPESKKYVQSIMADLRCDLGETYFDVPRMRTSTSNGYLTTGIAYAWHPHRDTWYSAPQCQINWWIPMHEITPENAMAFHPAYFGQGIQNDSINHDYGKWARDHRGAHLTKLTKSDPRPLSKPLVPIDPDPQIRLIVPEGGIILFSAAQLHSSVPNTSGITRLSIDFRTVHRGDAAAKRGAPNVDSKATGTNLGDFLRGTDLTHLPPEVIQAHEVGTTDAEELEPVSESAR